MTTRLARPWDYLIVTASNSLQARAYESQISARRELGMLRDVQDALVVPDPGGRRVGSGGSTLFCLQEVLNREAQSGRAPRGPGVLRGLRVLIVHAGGDSRRLPAYGPCGKVFVPVPGGRAGPLGATLFDRLLPALLRLPAPAPGAGQVVIASGDALLLFDPEGLRLDHPGVTAVASRASAEAASKHGVYCPTADGRVRLYLQKPSPEEQRRRGAVDREGKSLLDIGVMSFDDGAVEALFGAFGLQAHPEGGVRWEGPCRERVESLGLDIYREVCCALGDEATAAHHADCALGAGSPWSREALESLYRALRRVPFHLQVVPRCRFLHFGTTRQLIDSGLELLREEGPVPEDELLVLNTLVTGGGTFSGRRSWVEGCRVAAPLRLSADNVVVGVDVNEPLSLPEGTALEVIRGRSRGGETVWFVRCYGVADSFKDPLARGATFGNRPLAGWMEQAGLRPADLWDPSVPEGDRSLWNARVFPAAASPEGYRGWLWLLDPASASPERWRSFRAADRYSAEEAAELADQEAFHARRRSLRSG